MVEYTTWRVFHVAGAILLLGNVTVTGVWSAYLYRHWRAGTVPFRPVARAILWTDLIFTVTGGALLTFTGIQLGLASEFSFLETGWLLRGILSLALSTLIWLVVLLPDQFRLERATEAGVIRRLFLRWSVFGWLSTALLYIGLWSMVKRL
jgi:uncharacterized membrane protein